MRPEQRLSMSEQAAAVRKPITICPECGIQRFYAGSPYYLTDGTKRRTRICVMKLGGCGYARSETVLDPIVDGAPESAGKTPRSGSFAETSVEETDLT